MIEALTAVLPDDEQKRCSTFRPEQVDQPLQAATRSAGTGLHLRYARAEEVCPT